jgi:WD40 repeat protein
LIAIVGDDCDVYLHDTSASKAVDSMSGHLDWSFAVAWHPNGNLLATGNQDSTTRLWDIRRPGSALATLPATMGSIRACRFSADGNTLAVAEPADFVHLYDVRGGLCEGQDVDFFGEISGISFSPDSSALFVGIPDPMYNSVLCFRKVRRSSASS